MPRVASLFLPEWPLDRLRRRGALPATPPERVPGQVGAGLDELGPLAAAERGKACSVPRGGGWRPGARWARGNAGESAPRTRGDVRAEIDRLPPHQRPPMRELGRRTEAAVHPFKGVLGGLPADDGAARAGRPDRAPYPGEGRFFLTGRMTGDPVGRAAGERAAIPAPRPASPHPAAVPTVTAERVGTRVLVAAACPAARAAGIEPGQPLTRARVVAPGLRVFPADRGGDRAELLALARAAARRWSPAVALSGEEDHGLFVDLTGCAHLHGGEARWARGALRVLARLGIEARVAVADTAGAAWALARYGAGPGASRAVLCPPGAHPEMVAGLPLAALRLEPQHVELLRRLGADTVAHLAALPRKGVARRFGGALVRRLDQATGTAPEPLRPVDAPEPVRAVRRFAEPVMTAETIDEWLKLLVPVFCRDLARAGLGVRAVAFAAERVDGTTQAIRVGLSRASREPEHLLRLFRRRIEEVRPGWGLDSLGLHALRVEPLGAEALVPELAGRTAPDLAALVDAVANRLGAGRVWRDAPVESDVPERSLARAAPLDPPGNGSAAMRPDDVRRLDRRTPAHPWDPRWPRPPYLLRRPEEVLHVVSELPDRPPARFTWRGETLRVVGSDGPERIAGEWWRRLGEASAVRDYWQVEVEGGRRYWLYRRGDGRRAETGDLRWFLHGLFA